jgi:predicted PurR-regulated permease PerM
MPKKELIFPTVTVVIVAAVAVIVFFSSETLFPVGVAFLLACIFEPLVLVLQKRGLSRAISIWFVLCATFIIAVVGIVFFATSIGREFRDVRLNLPEYAERLYGLVPPEIKNYLDIETPDKAYRKLDTSLEQLRGVSFDIARETLSFVKRAVSSTLTFILAVLGYIVIPIYLYYFLKDMPKIQNGLTDLVPERLRPVISSKATEIHGILSGFVRGQLTVCAILAVLYSCGLLLIGIDLAVVIGTLSGILFIVPYLGTIVGIVFSMLMAVLKFHDILHPLLCLGWFGAVQAIEGFVVTPKIVGDRVGLHPMVTLVALLVGGQLFGITGMLIAVPLTAVLKVFLSSYISSYRSTPFYTGQ